MVFKPPIQNQPGQTLNLPTAILISLEVTQRWRDSVPLDETQYLADQIIYRHYNDLAQFIAGSRQMRGDLMGQRTARDWGELRADFSYNQGQEVLHLIVRPEKTYTPTGGRELVVGGVFDVVVQFTGFPLPSMGSNGGSGWGTAYQYNNPMYPFDAAFSPNDPGETSVTDTTLKVVKCENPTTTPDLLASSNPTGILLELVAVNPHEMSRYAERYATYSNIVMPLAFVSGVGNEGMGDGFGGTGGSNVYGVPQSDQCDGVAGTAILTQPLNGKQYWEVEIITLPSGKVPSASEYTTWPQGCDAFCTPLIGVCPQYYLPNDLRNADPKSAPQKFQSYMRPLGCDPFIDPNGPKNLLARSIYMSRIARDVVTVASPTFYSWIPGQWYITPSPNGSGVGVIAVTGIDITGWYATLAAWNGQGDTPSPAAGNQAGLASDNPFVTVPGWGTGTATNIPPQTLRTTPTNMRYSIGTTIAGNDVVYVIVSIGVDTGATVDLPVRIPYWVAWGPSVGPTSAGIMEIAYGSDVGLNDGGVCYANVMAYSVGSEFVSSSPTAGALGSAYVFSNNGPFRINYVRGIKIIASPAVYNSGIYGDILPFMVSTSSLSSPAPPPWTSDLTQVPQSVVNQYQPGYYAPVFIGRADELATQTVTANATSVAPKIGDGSSLPLDGSLAQPPQVMGNIGQMTGVDLGDLNVGDVIMVATDAATGYIWFGKNGSWYGPPASDTDVSAPLAVSDGPAHGTKWTAIMDGFSKSATPVTPPPGNTDPTQEPPMYYPAVGWHVGPMEVKIHYGAGMKYSPPSGFMVYGQAKIG